MKIFLFVLAATIFEAVGDSVIRLALSQTSYAARIGFYVIGMALLTLYGTSLNLAPVDFAAVTGLYVAILFVMFQITNFVFFRTTPTLPVLVGGLLIVAGGLIVSIRH